MGRKRKKSNNPDGRPSKGLTEAIFVVTGPAALLAAVATRAKEEGISTAEAWRRAARLWLWRDADPTATPVASGTRR